MLGISASGENVSFTEKKTTTSSQSTIGHHNTECRPQWHSGCASSLDQLEHNKGERYDPFFISCSDSGEHCLNKFHSADFIRCSMHLFIQTKEVHLKVPSYKYKYQSS